MAKTCILSCTSIAVCVTTLRVCSALDDMFLFAGQSNMLGHPTSDQSIEGGRNLFEDSLELEGTALLERIDQANRARVGREYDPVTAVRTSHDLMGIKNAGILDRVLEVMENSFCSLNEGEEVPVQAYASCGGEFGIELSFAHTLKLRFDGFGNKSSNLHVHKACVGGKLVADFLPGGSEHLRLLNAIDRGSANGAYTGFVWYQGENDVFQQTSEEQYYKSLNSLINLSTERMHGIGRTSEVYAESIDIPVFIFKLGFWPQFGSARAAIDLAHERVVSEAGRPTALIGGGDQYSQFIISTPPHS